METSDEKIHYLRNPLNIGLVGFGVVGKGLYDVLQTTPGLHAEIKKICIKHPQKKREIAGKYFTDDFNELLQDESINVIAELIDDADAAFEIVKACLENGKPVVSANKKMIAQHFKELLYLQRKYNTPFLYEAACCAGIPIIRNLEEYYDNDMLSEIKGIVNGSTNFILTEITENNLAFDEALAKAQLAGFAESNPRLDTEGHDAANKLVILAAHAFGTVVSADQILYTGITGITISDATFAREKNCSIKLVAHAKKLPDGNLALSVLPKFIKNSDDFYNVKNEYNALETVSAFADKHFFKGKGAGAYPTAAAVLSDISALRYDYRYGYKKIDQLQHHPVGFGYKLNVSVGARHSAQIDFNAFTQIESKDIIEGRIRVNGTVEASDLFRSAWWKAKGVSLILTDDVSDKGHVRFSPLTQYKFTGTGAIHQAGAFVE